MQTIRSITQMLFVEEQIADDASLHDLLVILRKEPLALAKEMQRYAWLENGFRGISHHTARGRHTI